MPELAAAAPPAGQPDESMPAMSFLEHLEELRRRIIYAIIAVAVGFFACWGYAERIYSIIQKPLIEVLKRHNLPEKLVFLSPTEPFNLYLKIGLMAGVFVASPLCIYHVWLFISLGCCCTDNSYVSPFLPRA